MTYTQTVQTGNGLSTAKGPLHSRKFGSLPLAQNRLTHAWRRCVARRGGHYIATAQFRFGFYLEFQSSPNGTQPNFCHIFGREPFLSKV